mmetsp:Transcript_9477/g.38944  ORF Transcript_9477/g.38944 Transcript_9477/m.38944 type:complete len:206 (-) Transcript_9477:2180-2797(-)
MVPPPSKRAPAPAATTARLPAPPRRKPQTLRLRSATRTMANTRGSSWGVTRTNASHARIASEERHGTLGPGKRKGHVYAQSNHLLRPPPPPAPPPLPALPASPPANDFLYLATMSSSPSRCSFLDLRVFFAGFADAVGAAARGPASATAAAALGASRLRLPPFARAPAVATPAAPSLPPVPLAAVLSPPRCAFALSRTPSCGALC